METMEEKKQETIVINITNVNLKRILIGLTELSKHDIPNFDINLGIARLVKKLSPIEIAYNKTIKAYMDEHIPIDKTNGAYVVDGNKMYLYKSAKDKDLYAKKINELNDKETKVTFCIKASELKKIKGLKAEIMVKINELIFDDLE